MLYAKDRISVSANSSFQLALVWNTLVLLIRPLSSLVLLVLRNRFHVQTILEFTTRNLPVCLASSLQIQISYFRESVQLTKWQTSDSAYHHKTLQMFYVLKFPCLSPLSFRQIIWTMNFCPCNFYQLLFVRWFIQLSQVLEQIYRLTTWRLPLLIIMLVIHYY